jgi:hypothetical protein
MLYPLEVTTRIDIFRIILHPKNRPIKSHSGNNDTVFLLALREILRPGLGVRICNLISVLVDVKPSLYVGNIFLRPFGIHLLDKVAI